MKQKIIDFDRDDEDHWRAILACGIDSTCDMIRR